MTICIWSEVLWLPQISTKHQATSRYFFKIFVSGKPLYISEILRNNRDNPSALLWAVGVIWKIKTGSGRYGRDQVVGEPTSHCRVWLAALWQAAAWRETLEPVESSRVWPAHRGRSEAENRHKKVTPGIILPSQISQLSPYQKRIKFFFFFLWAFLWFSFSINFSLAGPNF